MSDCSCGLPENAVILNELHIVEYMDDDGEIFKLDLSHGGDFADLSIGKQLELCEWGRLMVSGSILADIAASYRES